MPAESRPIAIPFTAALEDLSGQPAPRFLEILEFIPTPIPVEIAPENIVTGNARVMAARLVALILPTNIESTVLYKACIIIAKTEGVAILSINLPTGSVPNLSFSVIFSILRIA